MFGDVVPEQKKLKLLNYQNRIILQKKLSYILYWTLDLLNLLIIHELF